MIDDYDAWNKKAVELAANDPETVEKHALDPRPIRPRNLRQGIYRFGRRPLDIYRRAHQGIAGTPMPGVGDKMTAEELWHIVRYVESLPYDALSLPRAEATNVRERL